VPRLEEISAVILAGGAGTRLRSVVADRPKSMALIHGRPFLSFLLDELAKQGLRHVVLSTGYMADVIKSEIGNAHRGMTIEYSHESSPLGTAGAFRLALPLMRSDPVLAMNGDSFCQTDLTEFLGQHISRKAAASLVTAQLPDVERYGQVRSDANGQVTAFLEKGAQRGAGSINAGVYLLSRAFLDSIPTGQAVSIERESFPAWLGRALYASPLGKRFIDIGTPESYAAAESFFA
jgi:D-glycero-alpha-D-manno-heptose 1-phosphate guanylyltransferase